VPRPKRSVGFYRGRAYVPEKARLMPPVDRYSNTPVDAWPSAYRAKLRSHLLALRAANPEIGTAELVRAAQGWMLARERPSGVKSVGINHVQALLAVPRPASTTSKKRSSPVKLDSEPHPTTLSAAEIADVIRRSRALDARRAGTDKRGKPAEEAAASQRAKTPRKAASAARAKAANKAAQSARATAGGRRLPPSAAIGTSRVLGTHSTSGGAAPPAPAMIGVSARAYGRDGIRVSWPKVRYALRVRVDVLDRNGARVRRSRDAADTGSMQVGKLGGCGQPLSVVVMLTAAGGEILARGETSVLI
jgi:hypothetical protein